MFLSGITCTFALTGSIPPVEKLFWLNVLLLFFFHVELCCWKRLVEIRAGNTLTHDIWALFTHSLIFFCVRHVSVMVWHFQMFTSRFRFCCQTLNVEKIFFLALCMRFDSSDEVESMVFIFMLIFYYDDNM